MQKIMFLMVMALLCLQLNAQVEITGKVTDEDGEALIGANVMERGTNNSTVTDIDGTFSLTLKDSIAVLVINYTGFESQEIKLNKKRTNLSIKLIEGVTLDEVVVTSLSIRREKKSIGYARTTISKQNLSGAKKKPKIRIRGRSSNNSNYNIQQSIKTVTPNTEDYDQINKNRFYQVNNEPQSTFSIDVDAASYSNMRRFLNNGQLPPKDAVRLEEMTNYFDYDYPTPKGDQPFE
ncbi:MAG: von Willebrand factor type A domain-containing protein, partial [Bacteroidota bacterium]